MLGAMGPAVPTRASTTRSRAAIRTARALHHVREEQPPDVPRRITEVSMAPHVVSARVAAAFALAIPLLVSCEDPDVRADIVVYGDHLPPRTDQGNPFPNPFTAQSLAGDPVTTAAFKEIPGLQNPRGSVSWGVAAWAKYVFLGNYSHKAELFGHHVEDQRVGLYDSERKTFCQLDLDPAHSFNAGVEWLSVANPKARRTRIFYEGLAISGFPFGFIAGDLNNADPCDPTNGWIPRSKGFPPAALNRAAREAHQPDACPKTPPDGTLDGFCSFDGMTVLNHDDATNTDTVEIGNWISNRIIIAQIDGANQLHVLKVHVLPL